MQDPRVRNLAKTLVNYSVEVQPGDQVVLAGSLNALPLVSETYRQIIRAGGHPLLQLQDDSFTEILLRESGEEQLRFVPEPMKLIFETYDCLINIRASGNTRELSGVDPARQRMREGALSKLMDIYVERAAKGSLRWVSTLYPTGAHAQDADMSLTDYEDFVFGACFADKPDPIQEWQRVSRKQQRFVDWLKDKDQLVIKGSNVDLQLSVKDRAFINADGRRNMPDGEVFTGPVENSVHGWVRFSYPAIVGGREVSGVELVFADGEVAQASAEKNEPYLMQMLDSDKGARYLGEFAIGTNSSIQQFTKSILYDEKIGGTIHMALGRGYPETGSKNVSAIHWDLICDMREDGEIFADGELFYRHGEFLI